jgi:hypothetical protein
MRIFALAFGGLLLLLAETQETSAAEPQKPASTDGGVAKPVAPVRTSTRALSKEDLELAQFMEVLEQDHELLENLEILKLLPALED